MNHPDWPAFVAAIVAEPDDDTARLVAADFLEEHGDPDRAAFIRAQIELARLEASGLAWSLRANELRKRERMFLGPFSYHPHLWAQQECPELLRRVSVDRPTAPLASLHTEGADRLGWRRGFVERVYCPAADWLRRGAAVRARNPVREVAMSEVLEPTRDAWYAGLDALRGLRRLDLYENPTRAGELVRWLGEWLPETAVSTTSF